MANNLEGTVPGATTTNIGGVTVDEVQAGSGRVKRVIYPPGWEWTSDMQPITGTTSCQHVHIGFIAQGTMAVEFADGCTFEYTAPAAIVTEPGHIGRVVGDQAVVLIQVDCGRDTEALFGLSNHHHEHQ
ncbi:MAG: hypothetical protein OEW29_15825 [Acidimicrobiia bacterium]|nr:hypothetical protein [Acidimicrobiia bacterium]